MRGRRRVLPSPSLSFSLAVALGAAACAQPSGPVEVPLREIPVPLTRAEAQVTPDTLARGVTVYFVRDGRLFPVHREASGYLPAPDAAMQALLRGPTAEELVRGISSKVPFQTSFLQVRVFDQVAEVDLSGEFQGPAPPNDIVLRVAQVVWTLAAVPDISAVRFSIDGNTVSEVVTDGGFPVDRPVTAPDYADVGPHGPS